MKKLNALLFAFIILSAFTITNKVWKSDGAHSQLLFTVTHLGIADVTGTVNDFNVTIQSEKKDFSDAVIELKAKTASLNTRIEARDKHLRSADFFDAENNPEIHFISTSLKPNGKDKYVLTGNLTMHGITKTVEMDLQFRGIHQNTKNNKTIAGFKLSGNIDRTEFNIGNNFPDAAISNKVMIQADGEFSL